MPKATEWDRSSQERLPSQPLHQFHGQRRPLAEALVAASGTSNPAPARHRCGGCMFWIRRGDVRRLRRAASSFLPPWTMSTRSFIARRTTDGYEGVYCHFDGYVDFNGAVLSKYYRDPETVAELLSLGDMSSLGERVGEKHTFFERDSGATTYYGRDRGEDGPQIATKRCASLQELMGIAESVGCEYFYLFHNRQWEYAERGPQFFGLSDGSPFSPFKELKIT